VRAIAVGLQGQIIAQTTRSYPLLTPQPGWTEQNPSDWVEASLDALSDITQQLDGHRAIALGLSGQMHGMVPLDAEGRVIRAAILWNDQRTGTAVEEIEAVISRQELIQRTGNPAITGFQLPKLVWLRTEEPQAYALLRQILLPKDYLGYVLTGERVTEPSDASGVGCLNLATRQWDTDILNALNISPALFPTVVESTAIAGRLKSDIAARVGLSAGLPVVAGGGDNAAAVGLGISSSNLNRGSLSIGTSGVIFAPCDRPIPDPEGRVHLFCHVDGGYHLLGVTLAAGGSLRWYRDTVAPQIAYTDLMNLAERSLPGARGILFLPHLSGERSPHLDPDTRGAWVNLSLAHTQADLTRAVLEGVAFSLRAALEVISEITPVHQLLATGGGARSIIWLQILADVLQTELIAPRAEEGAAYGATILAMVGVGAYPNLDAAFKMLPQEDNTVQPQANPVYEAGFKRYELLYEALKAVC
jgi:xylulokinase